MEVVNSSRYFPQFSQIEATVRGIVYIGHGAELPVACATQRLSGTDHPSATPIHILVKTLREILGELPRGLLSFASAGGLSGAEAAFLSLSLSRRFVHRPI